MFKICYVVTIPMTIESFFIPQLRFLAENEFNVTVICSNDSTLQEKLGDSIRFYPINIPRGVSIVGSLFTLKSLIQFFKKEKFDLIQYSTPNAAFYSSIAARIVGCKIRNYHLMGIRYLGAAGLGRMILKLIEKFTCYNSTSIECVSKSNMELGIKEGLFGREKVTVVWNGSSGGVDLSRFNYSYRNQWRAEIRKTLGYHDDDFIYGYVGRITKDKGINELLSAFFKVNDDSKLLLVGNIETNNCLDKDLLIKASNNSSILFHDYAANIEKYYAAIDVLILPSYREGFGNVIIETAAMGTPSIISDIAGPIDAVEIGKTALVIKPKDVNSLIDAMKIIRTIDCKKMGKDAEQYVRLKFDSAVLCRKILERKEKILCQV